MVLFSCKKENTATSSIITSNPYLEKARAFKDKDVSDSAFYYFNLAKNAFLVNNDSLGVARALTNMAIIQTEKGDYYGSVETSLRVNKFLKNEKETDSIVELVLAANYNNLGVASSNLKNFDSSVSYYNKALKYVNVEKSRLIYYNNIGDVLISQKKFALAKKYLNLALASKDSIDYARALNNLARAKFLENKNYNPLPELFKALEIRKKENNGWAENSSYATLADYFYNKDQNTSLMYAKMMLEKAIQNKSADDQLEALQKIIILDKTDYLKNFLKFQSINDSLLTARNKDKGQFAVFRYDIDVKTAENELLKAATAESKNRTLILLIVLILAIITIIWYNRRQKRLKQENELKIKNTQLKLSKKVHDVVANGIYQVMTKIENQEQFDKDKMLDELEFVYEKSRDISYEKTESGNEEKDFSEEISELIGSFNNENVKTYLAGNDKNIWFKVEETTKDEIYQIIRELLVNMKKHSKADRVVFRFERENDVIKIYYTDNGIGISGDVIHKNGLSSTVSRMETMSGEIIFDNKTEKGLKINISFPVS